MNLQPRLVKQGFVNDVVILPGWGCSPVGRGLAYPVHPNPAISAPAPMNCV